MSLESQLHEKADSLFIPAYVKLFEDFLSGFRTLTNSNNIDENGLEPLYNAP